MLQPPVGLTLYTGEQIRAVELAYAKSSGLGTYPLMEKAGQAAFNAIRRYWPNAKKLLVLSGKGNNGGDGYVVADLASQAGFHVVLCNFCEPDKIKGDAKTAFDKLDGRDILRKSWSAIDLAEYDLVVDAMLGTGISGAVREPFVEPIKLLNKHSIPVLAIDIPSGLNADTGEVVNCAVEAQVTVTYIGCKRGLYTGHAINHRGETLLDKLEVDSSLYPADSSAVLAENWQSLQSRLPARLPSAHKGTNGHCQIIGGAKGYTGAAILASKAAARSGSGLTSTWLEEGALALVSVCPEVMAKNIAEHDIVATVKTLDPKRTYVLGPGLGRENWGQSWMSALLQNADFEGGQKVVDADALNWLAKNPIKNTNWVLTPHPGEAARLLSKDTSEINADRFCSAQQIAAQYGGVCVLKGAGTIIADQNGRLVVCPVGNPGMASGGMGDVLSGIIGGLLAQGISLFDAAVLGVAIHGEAAERAAGEQELYRGLLASDLIQLLPHLVNPQQPTKFN